MIDDCLKSDNVPEIPMKHSTFCNKGTLITGIFVINHHLEGLILLQLRMEKMWKDELVRPADINVQSWGRSIFPNAIFHSLSYKHAGN